MDNRMLPVQILLACLLALLVSACGQKGPLYIPPEQQSPAAAPAVPAATTADDLDRELEQGQPPAETEDEETLEPESEPDGEQIGEENR